MAKKELSDEEKDIIKEYIEKGNQAIEENNPEKAILYFDEALKLDENNIDALSNKGVVMSMCEQYAQAIEMYDKAISLKDNNSFAWYNKGLTLAMQGLNEEADNALDKALEYNKNSATIWLNKGVVLSRLNKYSKAIEAYEEVLKLDIKNIKAWSGKALNLVKINLYQEAIEAYDEVLKLNNKDKEAWLYKGILLDASSLYKEAAEAFDELLKINKNNAEIWILKATALRKSEQKEEAIQAYDELLKLDKKNAEAWFNKGIIWGELERFDNALQAFNKVLELDKKNIIAWFNRGIVLGKLNRHREAIDVFDRVLKLGGPDVETLINKGLSLRSLEKYEEALKVFTKALKLDKKNILAWLNKGIMLSELKRPKKAIKALDETLKLDKKHVDARAIKAMLLEQLGRYEEAIQAYNEFLKLDKKNTKIRFNKLALLIKLDRFDEALATIAEIHKYGEDVDIPRRYTIDLSIIDLFSKGDYKKIKQLTAKHSLNALNLLRLLNAKNEAQSAAIKELAKAALKNDDFFNRSVKKKDKYIEEYKSIYIQSLRTVALLHVNSKRDLPVAHYTRKVVAENLLLKDKNSKNVSCFRLSTVVTANDPREGKPLLQYLGVKDHSINDLYQAFTASFIFNPDCLNQFRLYGKDKGIEATGVSLVVNSDYFNEDASINKKIMQMNSGIVWEKVGSKADNDFQANDHTQNTKEKESLFRCIYIDPLTQQVISIGHKDNYIFYRDELRKSGKNKLTENEIIKIESEIQKYEREVKETLEKVKLSLVELKNLINEKLDHAIIGELLIHLRYLVKHVAFKEEQECRIIKIEPLHNNSEIQVADDNSRMYIDYRPIDQNVTDIYFGPKATGMALFQDLLKREGLDIKCHQSDHPFF